MDDEIEPVIWIPNLLLARFQRKRWIGADVELSEQELDAPKRWRAIASAPEFEFEYVVLTRHGDLSSLAEQQWDAIVLDNMFQGNAGNLEPKAGELLSLAESVVGIDRIFVVSAYIDQLDESIRTRVAARLFSKPCPTTQFANAMVDLLEREH